MDEMGLEMKVQSYKLGVRGIELWKRENQNVVLNYGKPEEPQRSSAKAEMWLVRNVPSDSLRDDV